MLLEADLEKDERFNLYMTGVAANDWASHGVPNCILLEKPFAPAQVLTAMSQLLNAAAPGQS